MCDAYDSRAMGWFVVLVARNNAVSLYACCVSFRSSNRRRHGSATNYGEAACASSVQLDLCRAWFDAEGQYHSHDVLWMPVHDCVFQVKPLEISNGRGFYFLGEAEVAAQLRDLAHIQLHKKMLLMGAQE